MTHQAKDRSADCVNNRLVDLKERMATATRTERAEAIFKAPTFNGKGDVEYFIIRSEEISTARNWRDDATFLHLRDALQEGT